MCNQYQKYIFAATFLFILSFLPASQALSAAQPPTAESSHIAEDDNLPVLPQVTVTGTRTTSLSGETTINRSSIETLPERNGNVTDLLLTAPGTQFSEENNNSFTSGEIRPAEISISGGRTYENNFLIDGMSNKNYIDPGPDLPTIVDNLPGHSQSTFLDTSLIDHVTVYDHNISARYGGFTGGVVEAVTKNPAEEFSGRLFYRRTSDNWTSFHVDEEDRESFYDSDFHTKQPEFTKQQTGFELNLPISSRSGLLLAYSLNYSEIPLTNLETSQDQVRRSDNLFLKYANQLSSDRMLSVSAIYAPYTESYFLRRTKDSDFDLKGENLSFATSYEKIDTYGTLTLDASFQSSDRSRDASDNLLTWLSNIADVPTSKDWGLLFDSNSSKEGGLGDLSSQQQVLSMSADWISHIVPLGPTRQIINFGIAADRITAELKRATPAYAFSRGEAITDGTLCLENDIACIENEQYLSRRKTYPAGKEEDTVFQYSLYLEDQLSIDRFTARPGGRISRDTLMENTDIAPRLSASYLLSERYGTTLIAGWNRYYSQNLLAYRLRGAISPSFNDDRSSADESFAEFSGELAPPKNRFSRLKTPYADETSVGIVQKLLRGELALDYIQRNNHDQLAREFVIDPEGNYFALNNNGSGEYESYRVRWTREWRNQFLEVNATYEETLSSNEDYDTFHDDDDLFEQVWYKGDLLFKDELPREDFNRPWTANLIYTTRLNPRTSFTNTTRYQSHYRAIEDSKENTEDGYDIYVDVRRSSTVSFDWNLSYDVPLAGDQTLGLDIDIFNVFNKKNQVGTEEDEYSLGRQVWLGMEYIF